MDPVYLKGTTADQIVHDGWARGFEVEQTLEELVAQGFMANKLAVLKTWVRLDEERDINHG